MSPLVEGRMDDTDPEDTEGAVLALRSDACPDCGRLGLTPGPRDGAGQNLFCPECGGGWNVTQPRHILFAERIRRPGRA
jgi:hypothetical protein